ncbi:MAG: hypothetical protein H5T98_01030 [Syntrophomonadaceae bacterium]|nr:hypothetical protein [Syntrophomonadaceae bacterium]
MATEFKIGEHTYSVSRMDAFTQLYVGMKVSPLVLHIAGENATLAAFSEALAQAPLADVEFVTKEALKVIKRRAGTSWTDIYNASAGKMMFEDIDGADLMELVYMALKDGIAPFFSRLVSLVFGTNPLASDS